MTWFRAVVICTAIAMLLSCAAASGQASDTASTEKTKGQSSPQPGPSVLPNDPSYQIGPEDMLNINVWKEPDVSGSVPVRPDGKISLPLLNDVQAAGLTPIQLAVKIQNGLKQYITDPRVTVTVTNVNSKRIFLMGEVARPGAYPLLPNMTVLQALSSAGGFTQFSNLKKIYVLRTDQGKQLKLPFNYKAAINGTSPEQNYMLKAGDTIVVP